MSKKLFLGLTTQDFDLTLATIKSSKEYTIKHNVYVIPKEYIIKNVFLDKKNKEKQLYCMYYEDGVHFEVMTESLFKELFVADDDMPSYGRDIFENLENLTYVSYSSGLLTMRYVYNELEKKYLSHILLKMKMTDRKVVLHCKLFDVKMKNLQSLNDIADFLNSFCSIQFSDGNIFTVPVLLYILMKNNSRDYTYKSLLRLEKSEKDFDFPL